MSNLPFISKVLEKVVASRLTKYLESNRLMSKSQSAYRRFHSTESALLRLLSDLMSAVESGRIALLALLDMSAAFDTVDHSILLRRLNKTYGIRGGAQRWIESYLTDHTQRVCIQGTSSNDVPLLYEVPQGSVLGPLLFILYTGELEQIINSHGLLAYSYADNNKISFFCSPEETERLKAKVINSVEEISRWMSLNRLKVNPTKTEFLWTVTRRRKRLIPREAIRLNGVDIAPSRSVKLLGVHIDDLVTIHTNK